MTSAGRPAPVGQTIVDLIARKRDGGHLTGEELGRLVRAHLAGEMDDAQMAAFLMAGVLRGFSRDEAIALTEILAASGGRVDLSALPGPTVDKHSTGGVGDTATLVVGPLLAATGCQVAKLSGAGLGHTGGTIDKLASIPGFRVDLSPRELCRQVERVGIAVSAAGPELAPADRRLYALRDVTATVQDPALIASSIMSKKLAGGAAHVLLDVKVGNGALLGSEQEARDLAELCVAIGRAHGRATGALLTQMSEPSSDAIGNALEVGAAIEVLRGERGGPLREVSLALTSAALRLTGRGPADAQAAAVDALDSGRALEAFREWIRAQGGPADLPDAPWRYLPVAPVRVDWMPDPGVVGRLDTRALGLIAGRLGAARTRQGQPIDPAVGLEVLVRTGSRLESGQPAARVHARSAGDGDAALEALTAAVELVQDPVPTLPTVLGEVGVDGPGDPGDGEAARG